MSAEFSDDFMSILDKKIASLQEQLRVEQGPLSFEVQERLAAGLRIRRQIRLAAGPERKPIDALAEWCRWERDALAFEPKP